jgi:hypothetical protein
MVATSARWMAFSASELAKPGDFIARAFVDESIFALRDKAGGLSRF